VFREHGGALSPEWVIAFGVSGFSKCKERRGVRGVTLRRWSPGLPVLSGGKGTKIMVQRGGCRASSIHFPEILEGGETEISDESEF